MLVPNYKNADMLLMIIIQITVLLTVAQRKFIFCHIECMLYICQSYFFCIVLLQIFTMVFFVYDCYLYIGNSSCVPIFRYLFPCLQISLGFLHFYLHFLIINCEQRFCVNNDFVHALLIHHCIRIFLFLYIIAFEI